MTLLVDKAQLTALIEHALCTSVRTRAVPAGIAVSTDFLLDDRDRIGFYVLSEGPARLRIADDGATVPFLVASGLDLDGGTRGAAFDELLTTYGFRFDEEAGELTSAPVAPDGLAGLVMRFIALRLRLQDFVLLHPETVASSFRDDVKAAIDERFRGKANVTFGEALAPILADEPIDALIAPPGVPPVAAFFASSDADIYRAHLLRLRARHEAKMDCKVIAVMESVQRGRITARGHIRANNMLDRALIYRGGERETLDALEELAGGGRFH